MRDFPSTLLSGPLGSRQARAEGFVARFFSKRLGVALALVIAGVFGTIAAVILIPEPHELAGPVKTELVAGSPEFVRSMFALHGGNLYESNTIATLQNGEEIFPAMLDAIASAQRSINFETYVYWSGSIGSRFAEALAERAAAGIEVNVLLDWQGSVSMEDELIETMVAAGATVKRFRPIEWYTLDRFNARTHRKLLIVDGTVGFIGGVGIADKWLGDASSPDEFRELHYRVQGPVVASMQGAFAFNWLEATGRPLQGDLYFPSVADSGPIVTQLVYSSIGSRNVMHVMLMTALAAAQDYIRIGTAYFVPDEIAIAQLLAARQRGVTVDVLVPGEHTNKDFVRAASRHFWGDLLEAGVNFYEYDPTMYHAKITIVDESWTSIGSANFDERSFRLNDEANLNVFDSAFAAQQISIFQQDVEHSTLVTLEQWRSRPMWQKLTDWLASTLRVQL
jgi:cardiolipin synthase